VLFHSNKIQNFIHLSQAVFTKIFVSVKVDIVSYSEIH